MAKTNKVEVEIVAIDEASPTIDKLTKKIDGLESDEARIIVTSNIDRLDKQLTDALAKLHRLDGDEATVQARLVGNLEDDLRHANDLFEQLDGKTGTVRIDTVGATQNLDGLTKSANSGQNALANMVGNTTQDLGQMGGVAGSAGVAIGQMAEYTADAALQTGNLRGALAGMATVAGPIAGVSLALFAVNDILTAMREGQAATKAFDTKQVEQFFDAIKEGGDITANYTKQIEETGEVMAVTGQKTAPFWTQFIPGVREFTNLGETFNKFGSDLENIVPKLNNAGITSDQWSRIVTTGVEDQDEALMMLRLSLALTNTSEEERNDILIAAKAAQDNYNNSVVMGEQYNKFFAGSLDLVTAAAEAFATAHKPMEDMPETWKAAANGAARLVAGQQLTARQQQAINVLTVQYGIDAETVLKRAYQLWLDNHEAVEEYNLSAADAAQHTADFVDEVNAAVQSGVDLATGIRDTNKALDELVENQGKLREDALANALDVGDTPLDTLSSIHDIYAGFRQLADFLRDPEGLAGRVPNIFDPKDVEAGPFLSKLAQMRGPIQEQIARAFGEGGIEAASALAQQFISSMASQSGLDPSVVSTLLGLDNLQASIEISIKEAADATARRQLALLVALQGGESVFTAQLALGLDAGTITPEQVDTIVQQKLDRMGVTVPTSLADIDSDKELADLQRGIDATGGVTVPLRFISDRGQDAIFRNAAPTSVVNNTVNMPPQPPGSTHDNYLSFIELNADRTPAG